MSKIFRLYTGGSSSYEDWNRSPSFPYNSQSRKTIEDPDGANSTSEITSIPSPFARIDLIKTAFSEVCKTNKTGKVELDGNTIFHKMVSDTLDVAEIFFNIDKYKDTVEIIKWDPSLMIEELKNSNYAGHQYLADALEKYLKADSSTYNFGDMKNIYLLNYIKGPEELNIIGATSPATLFFSNANDLSYVTNIYNGNDKPFDSEYQPLYKRDPEFIKYLFALRKSIEEFSAKFPEVDQYLAATYTFINNENLRNELLNITSTYFSNLSLIEVQEEKQTNNVEVLGSPLYKKSSTASVKESEFKIKTTKATEVQPLILPVEAGNKYSELRYTTDKWGKTNAVAYNNSETDIFKRTLPFDGGEYPYLIIGDFLEDTIIKVPHQLNKRHYFDGNLKEAKDETSYLLPLKPLIFEYFSPEEIRGEIHPGKPFMEMTELNGGNGLKVTLRIPIEGNEEINFIEYQKIYYSDNKADKERNKGSIKKLNFTGFIMPLVKFGDEKESIYNVSCIQSSPHNSVFSFYKENLKLNIESKSRNEGSLRKVDNYILKGQGFDFIRLENQTGCNGIILPIFKSHQNIENFTFAIDLGTSNTHIEYLTDSNKTPRAFDFTQEEEIICQIFKPTYNNEGLIQDLEAEVDILEKDFIPTVLGHEFYKFPTRTVLSFSKTIDRGQEVDPYILYNIPFTYDKRLENSYNRYQCNIKWGKGKENRIMEYYIRTIMLMLRNKVMLNNGDLHKTKIIWFYPLSMPQNKRDRMQTAWDDAYKEYFDNGKTILISESEAPIHYFIENESTARNLIHIDIGGGTTDIAFAKDKNISHNTSFRFATNNIFENALSAQDKNNGIIDYYKDVISKNISDTSMDDDSNDLKENILEMFKSDNNKQPSNMASFLFSLCENEILLKGGINKNDIDFNRILQEDENFKIVILIFYSAIIFHIAQLNKVLGLPLPRHISFSGNGSKIVNVMTSNIKILENYTKLIFEKVYNTKYEQDFGILGVDNVNSPKAVTSKGGLIYSIQKEDIKDVILNSGELRLIEVNDTYASIDKDYEGKIINQVRSFLDLILNDLSNSFNFTKQFGISIASLKLAREILLKKANDFNTFLEKGIKKMIEESDINNKIEETLFFYPIMGGLNHLSAEIKNEIINSNK